MHANRHLSRFAIAAALLGAALTIGAGPLATPAEANRRHHKVVKVHPQHRHSPTVYRECAPRPRVVYRHVEPVRYHDCWYEDAPRFYVSSDPYYFHAGLNVYLGGMNLNVQFSDPAPYGYVYMDPYCHLEFASVDLYHRHLRRHRHQPALQVVFVGD